MQHYQYILFDMDGTLVDSRPGIIDSVQYAVKQFHLEHKSTEILNRFAGPPLIDSFKTFFGMDEEGALEATKVFRSHYAKKGILNSPLYPNVKNMLAELSKKYQLFVATSKPTVYAEQIVSDVEISDFFKAVVGSNLDNTRKTKKEVIAYILEQHQIERKESVLMIGDKEHDVVGARTLGIDALGVLYGYGSKEELEKAGAIQVVETTMDILTFLNGT